MPYGSAIPYRSYRIKWSTLHDAWLGVPGACVVQGATRMSIAFEMFLLAGVIINILIIMRRVTSLKAKDTLQFILETGLADV